MKKILAYPRAVLYISFPVLWTAVQVMKLNKEK